MNFHSLKKQNKMLTLQTTQKTFLENNVEELDLAVNGFIAGLQESEINYSVSPLPPIQTIKEQFLQTVIVITQNVPT